MSYLNKFRRASQQVVAFEVWVVAALAACCVIFKSLLIPVLVIAALFWLLCWFAYGRLSVHTPLDFPAGALILMLPVPLLATPLPEITLSQVYRLLVGMTLCYAIANHKWTPTGLRRSLVGLVGLGVGLGLLA